MVKKILTERDKCFQIGLRHLKSHSGDKTKTLAKKCDCSVRKMNGILNGEWPADGSTQYTLAQRYGASIDDIVIVGRWLIENQDRLQKESYREIFETDEPPSDEVVSLLQGGPVQKQTAFNTKGSVSQSNVIGDDYLTDDIREVVELLKKYGNPTAIEKIKEMLLKVKQALE